MLKCSLWAFLPPVYSAFTAAGLWVVYFVALRDGKIAPLGSKYRSMNGSLYPPYISVAGNFPKASCIFSEVMNLSAFVGFIIGFLRYLQLKPKVTAAWLNVGSLLGFSAGCFGMTLIGNFQLFTDMITHNIGALLTFGVGTLFCWAQSYITMTVNIQNEGRKTGIVRFLLSGFITVCFILYISLQLQHLHAQAAQSQWALVMFFLLFISTFAVEFRHSRFVTVCTEDCRSPVSLSESQEMQP
uniref:transmembrane protein 150C n=1 Tax=Scatophagus argus TaxID=75038 RepID=UPI001ED80F27|nr:transmembrane protein 150C [Scatophagus argus]